MKYSIALILALWLCFMPVSVFADEAETIPQQQETQEDTASNEPTPEQILLSVSMQGTGLQAICDTDIDHDGLLTVKDAYFLAVYLEKTHNGMILPLEDFMRQELFPFHVSDVREYRGKSFTYAHHNKPYIDVNPSGISGALQRTGFPRTMRECRCDYQ